MSAPRPKLWICDDSPTKAEITERSLGDAYDYERFVDGSVVVERLASADAPQPDALLLDWVMPGMTGDEVCRYLRSNPATRELPIIMVTASRIETNDVVAGLASGANDYVARPFAPEELRARVAAVLRAKTLREAATRERGRLDALNRFGHALLSTSGSVAAVVDKLATTLTATLCDGCSIVLLPGPFPATAVARHRADPSGAALALISTLADPVVHAFRSTAHARAVLPPAYHAYIDRFGLRGLAIMPFPIAEPIQGIVTVTRDGDSAPFDPDDIQAIESCIEYAALAVQTELRFEAERTARAQLHAVLEHIPIGIVATDASGAVTLVNATASEIVPGIHRAHALDDVAAIAGLPPSWASAHAQHSGLPSRAELATDRGGGAQTTLVSSVPLRGAHGVPAGSVTAFEDVTAERALLAERENIARFQEQMIGIVGHDLRNPLNAVTMGIALLDEYAKQVPAAKPVLKRLESSTRRMTRIVEQLLDVTRARLGGGIPMEPRMVEFVAVVRATVDELALAYPKVAFDFTDAPAVIGSWDPDRLAQVVSNLASNAAQYGAVGKPVAVQVLHDIDDTTVTLAVTNTNRDLPISPEAIATLFDPYRRGRDEHQPGLGLGLYIVHEIVQAHGGKIVVESGDPLTCFRVTLPIRTAR